MECSQECLFVFSEHIPLYGALSQGNNSSNTSSWLVHLRFSLERFLDAVLGYTTHSLSIKMHGDLVSMEWSCPEVGDPSTYSISSANSP